nr:CPARA_2gp269 [Cryptomonas curvata]
MLITNFKLLDYKLSDKYYRNVLHLNIKNVRFETLFAGRIFLEILLNKKINFFLFLKKFLPINQFHSENFYYIKNCLRKKFIILNSFVQCDIFSSYNIFNIIQYRNKLFFENFFQFFTTNLNRISVLSFFHKNIHGKTLFDVFNFFHYLPCEIIKANYLYSMVIKFLNTIENIKKNISKFNIKKEVTLFNTFKNNGNNLEVYLNHINLRKFLFYDSHIFYINPGFFTFIRMSSHKIDSLFTYFFFSFPYTLEKLLFLFEKKESKNSQPIFCEEYFDILNSSLLESDINFLIIIIQIFVNSSFNEKIVFLINFNSEINNFKYFIRKNDHFLIKLLFNKIKFNFF